MEDQGFMTDQWMASSYGDLSAIMPMAEAEFPEGDIEHFFSYDHQPPPQQLLVPTPIPEPYNYFSVAADASYFYSAPANPQENNTYNYSDKMLDHHQVLIPGQEAENSKSSPMSATTRTSPGSQEHIMAERRRRQKLNEMHIALSAAIPGLKKIDKASVLASAVKYIKHLEDQVKQLEDQTTKSKTIESVLLLKKSKIVIIDDTNSGGFSSETFIQGTPDETVVLPEIEARVCDENVLIRVHCFNKKGVIEKIIREVEKLHLNIVNSSVLALGGSSLNITLVAQMEAGCWMTVNDLVQALYLPLKSFL